MRNVLMLAVLIRSGASPCVLSFEQLFNPPKQAANAAITY
jgi:hypothetical protein